MTAGIMIFAVVCGLLAALVVSRFESLERAEAASYLVMVAWGALFFGITLARLCP